uniref:Immunoglobulin-binding protein 1 n=1 Tax=Caligus clemensi TaxID=344056 RepID=C1C2X2_CALCM|nr:Immunoglobulin-binding protein 1 [Caligus clemensi]
MSPKNEESLKALMMTGLRIQWEVEHSTKSSSELQERIKQGILILEDATRLVSILDIFSDNEFKDEILTESLPFLLLPALLGNLNGRLSSPGNRLEVLKNSQIYYRDFLTRCHDFEIIDFKAPSTKNEDSAEEASRTTSSPTNLSAMNAERAEKIRKYKLKKSLEEDTSTLHSLVFSNGVKDEEILRGYYINLITRFSLLALEELASIESEVEIHMHMEKMRSAPQKKEEAVVVPKPKFQPIIITRDEAQKRVFGLGYSSIPLYSVEEFYEQRVRDGWFPSPEEVRNQQASLMDRAMNPQEALLEEEDEERQKEEKIERDDPDTLMSMRAMDEYKDEHKRGEGNRHNMG